MSWKSKFGNERAQYKALIEKALEDMGMNQTLVAKKANVTRQAVSATLLGKIHSDKVFKVLRKAGIKEKYICDPKKHTK